MVKRGSKKKIHYNNNIKEYIIKKIIDKKSLPDMMASKMIIWLSIFCWIRIKSSNLFGYSELPAQLIPQGKECYIYTNFMITGNLVIAFSKYLHIKLISQLNALRIWGITTFWRKHSKYFPWIPSRMVHKWWSQPISHILCNWKCMQSHKKI